MAGIHPSLDDDDVGSDVDARVSFSEAMDLLWPGGQGGRLRHVLLPNATTPRLMVPVTTRAAAVSVIRYHSEPTSARRRTRTQMISTAAQLGVLRRFPGNGLRLRRDGRDIESVLSDLLNTPLQVGMHLGPPRANRKPVLTAVAADGSLQAFAKVAITPLSRRLLQTEATALQLLDERLHVGVVVPRLLGLAEVSNCPVLVQEPLPVDSPRIGDPNGTLLVAAMAAVSRSSGSTMVAVRSIPLLAELLRAADTLEQPIAGTIRSALHELTEHLGELVVEVGAWHGDWTHGNAAVIASGVLVWDWERYAQGVPMGMDRLHHALRSRVDSRGAVPQIAARSLLEDAHLLLAPFGMPPAASAAVLVLYLAEITARYAGDRQAAAGDRLADIELWLLPALTAAAARCRDYANAVGGHA